MLKSQDLVLATKLSSPWWQQIEPQHRVSLTSVRSLAGLLGLSKSEISVAFKRLQQAGLMHGQTSTPTLIRPRLSELLCHAMPYFFPVQAGTVTIGIPTAFAVPTLQGLLWSGSSLPYIWPDPTGQTEGIAVTPLHPTVIQAIGWGTALPDPWCHEVFGLVDALRLGGARERALAQQALKNRLEGLHAAD